MNSFRQLLVLTATATLLFASCKTGTPKKDTPMQGELPPIAERLTAYAPTTIQADLSILSSREKRLVAKLIEAGKLADEIFWKQSAPDVALSTPDAKQVLEYVLINYGPYDRIYEGHRFTGTGAEKKPDVAGYYPQDMTKKEFEDYVAANPAMKDALEGQYTVVVRDGAGFKAVPFNQAYPESEQIAAKLEEAALLADNASLRRYLQLRAKAIRTDDYYASDMAWMDIRDNNVDVVIGPIENYEDALFNYKTAYECAVVVKDPEGTKELQMFTKHIDAFEHALPVDKKFIRATAGSGNILEVVNIVYFGGDFQKGVKTIAASLPNDPRVTQAKGGKKQMYRNMMEAKFEKILRPIAERILEPSLLPFLDRKAFTSFVTLHEVSHTLGRGFVFGNDSLSVRRALKDRYSAIEECKADVLGLYNNTVLLAEKAMTEEQLKRAIVTYVAGLYRSLRFGAEEAHGRANLIQLNFLSEQGVITTDKDGRIGIDLAGFMDALGKLVTQVLTLQANGDYAAAGVLLEKYGVMNPSIEAMVAKLADVPRDLDTKYVY
ncbi:MAG: peptidase [Ignavibacteria bacterium]|nr:peptidase [Ignavibacteria bacterium]